MAKYLKFLLFPLSLSLLLIAATNWLVNPYGVFNSPVLEGINTYKTEIHTRERMNKTYRVNRIKPDTIILGTSRALVLDAQHPFLEDKHAFNLAISSSSAYEQWRYFQHANSVNKIKNVIIGIDHFAIGEIAYKDFVENRLNISHEGKPQNHFTGIEINDLKSSLLSWSAFRSSIKTLRDQSTRVDRFKDLDRRVLAKGGHRKSFEEVEQKVFWGGKVATNPETAYIYTALGSYSKPGSYRKLIRFCYSNDINLYMFLSPSHARYWEIWRIVGQQARVDGFKTALTAVNEEEARAAAKPVFQIWDFSGYNTITTETVPDEKNNSTLMWGYWEGSHYKPSVGNYIFDRIFNYKHPDRPLPDNFGVSINTSNINAQLEQVRYQGEKYRQANSHEITSMEKAFHKISGQKSDF